MEHETVQALCEVGRALGAEEITVLGARGGVRTALPFASANGNVLLSEEERKALCRDCERGEEVLLLDGSGVIVGLNAGPGVWSHGYDLSFWPCPGVRGKDER